MAEKKKILYIVEAMGGGVFTYIVDLANELVNKYDMYSEIAGAVVDLILNTLLIPQLSSVGAAIGTLVAEGVVWIVQFAALRKEVTSAYKNVRYGKVILAIVIGVVSSGWVKILGIGNFATLLLSAVLFFSGYAIVLIVLKEPLMWEIW